MTVNRFIAGLLIGGLSAGAINADDAIVRWSFDEVVDGTFRDLAGKAHANIEGAAGDDIVQPGLYNNAFLAAPGTSWLEIPADESPGLMENFTIHCVCKPFQVHSYRTLIWKGDRTLTPEAVNYLLGLRDGRVEFKYKDAEGRWLTFTAERPVEPNEWLDIRAYHSGRDMEIRVNGQPQKIVKTQGAVGDWSLVENPFSAKIGVGQNVSGQDYWFYGLIDELAIYSGRVMEYDDADDFEGKLEEYERRRNAFERERQEATENTRSADEQGYRRFFEKSGGKRRFIVRVEPTTMRLDKRGNLAKRLEDASQEISLLAAGNEAESAQLVVAAAPAMRQGTFTVRLGALKNDEGVEFPVGHMAWGPVESVTTERPGIAVDYVGAIPDVVRYGEKSFTLTGGGFMPVLVRYDVPAGTPPGHYRGSLFVNDGQDDIEVKVVLRVAGFSLPQRGTLKVAFSFFEKYYLEWFGKQQLTRDEKLSLYNFLLSYRIPPSNLYHTEKDTYPDFESLKLIGDRVNFLTFRGWGEKVVGQGEVDRRVERLRENMKKVEAMGMKDYAYFYGSDELWWHMDRNLPAAKQASNALSRTLPDLKMMQTSNPIAELRDLYNVWVPLIDYFADQKQLETFGKLQANGKELWWYLADTPTHPFPNLFLDYPVYDSRVLGVLSWKYGVDGLLYWAINREWVTNYDIKATWPRAAWKPYIYHHALGVRKSRNGMGNLIYPAPGGGLHPSLRLENLRDGLEDYEYLACLQRLVKSRDGDASPLAQQARALLAVPPQVATAVNDYNADPSALKEYREQVATMIERLQEMTP